MTTELWKNSITASVVPVVVISATGLLCLAFYNRLAMIVSRLRTFQRERLQQQELRDRALAARETDNVIRHERLIDLLAEQTEDVMRRARLMRGTLLFCLCAIALLLVCSFCCGVSPIWPVAIYPAVAAFSLGLLLLLGGVGCALAEMWASLEPVTLESDVVALMAP